MPRHGPFYQWRRTIAKHLPNLSKPQVSVLALWTWGMVCTRCASLTTVAVFLSLFFECPLNTMRQRLREFYQEAKAKAGQHRQDLDLSTCFAPLLRWVVEGWPNRQLPIALDASTLGAKFVVLAISVVYRGCAVPVAWKILPATLSTPWKDEWLKLLDQFRGAVPHGWSVRAMTDRGLWAPWLFKAIVALGWHPFMRINLGGKFCPDGQTQFLPLKSFTPKEGTRWRGRGIAFSTPNRQIHATLLAWWGPGHDEPWLILTDLAPEAGEADWYGLRSWIEQGFKDCKGGGWQWQHTRMSDPARAERLWLAIAVATLWLLRVGGEAEQKGWDKEAEASAEEDLLAALATKKAPPAKKQRRTKRWRLVSVFALGWLVILSALVKHAPLPRGRWYPEPWPEGEDSPSQPPVAPNNGKKTYP
jgi:Transposase DDE domain